MVRVKSTPRRRSVPAATDAQWCLCPAAAAAGSWLVRDTQGRMLAGPDSDILALLRRALRERNATLPAWTAQVLKTMEPLPDSVRAYCQRHCILVE